jgi:hypothetical protein
LVASRFWPFWMRKTTATIVVPVLLMTSCQLSE